MTPAASTIWPALPSDPSETQRAQTAMERLREFEAARRACPPPEIDEQFLRLGEALFEPLDPIALASQYAFALSSLSGLAVALVPLAWWKDERQPALARHPIARLMPQGSRDFSGDSDWSVPGYALLPQASALAQELMSRGFVWDPDFQAFFDQEWSMHPVAPFLDPILEARALEASVPSAPVSRSPARL